MNEILRDSRDLSENNTSQEPDDPLPIAAEAAPASERLAADRLQALGGLGVNDTQIETVIETMAEPAPATRRERKRSMSTAARQVRGYLGEISHDARLSTRRQSSSRAL